jgi:hypothetical protein
VDEAIAALNSPVPRRKDSGDSINLRDTGFDPDVHRRNNDSSSFMQQMGGDSFGDGGVGGEHTQNMTNFMDEEEKEAEE